MDVHALDASMLTSTPNVYLRVLWYQIGSLSRRRIDDVVEMHLVKMDLRLSFGQVEEVAAEFGELDWLVG
jgi:hypothetical protein